MLMKKSVAILLTLALLGGAIYAAAAFNFRREDEKLTKFNSDADSLIVGLQQYREFVGSYPVGNNIAVSKALLGQTDKRVLILTVRKNDMNEKGEILDPWGTPVQFYFSSNEVMVRSAGPNKVWEDSAVPLADDLYRCAPKK